MIIYISWGDLLSLNENVIFWRFFIIFNILNVLVRWKNGKFQSPKSSTGTSISLKSLIPLKERYLFFQNLFSKLLATQKKIFDAKKYK